MVDRNVHPPGSSFRSHANSIRWLIDRKASGCLKFCRLRRPPYKARAARAVWFKQGQECPCPLWPPFANAAIRSSVLALTECSQRSRHSCLRDLAKVPNGVGAGLPIFYPGVGVGWRSGGGPEVEEVRAVVGRCRSRAILVGGPKRIHDPRRTRHAFVEFEIDLIR